jgi:hypothetical protein
MMSHALLLERLRLRPMVERNLHRPCALLVVAPGSGDVDAEQPDYTGLAWFLRWCWCWCRYPVGGGRRRLGLLAVDEELLLRAVRGVGEDDGVPGSEALLPDEAAPALGEHVALAAVPVGVAEPPHLALPVLEVEEHALGGGGRLRLHRRRRALQREVLLGVLLGDHEAVELADVAGRDRLVEQQHARPGRRGLRAAAAAPQALAQLVGVGVLPQHVDDLRLGVGGQEGELGRRRAGAREVGRRLAAAVAERGHVVGARRGLLVGERAEPHPGVALVDLRAPAAVGLRHHALEARGALRHRRRLRRDGLLVRRRRDGDGVSAADRAAAWWCGSGRRLRGGGGLRGGRGRGGRAVLRRRRRGAHALNTHDELQLRTARAAPSGVLSSLWFLGVCACLRTACSRAASI